MKMKKDNSPAREKETRIGGCSSMQTNRSRDKKDESKLHSRVMRPFETEEKKERATNGADIIPPRQSGLNRPPLSSC